MIPAEVIINLQCVPGLGARKVRSIINMYPDITSWQHLLDCNLTVVDGMASVSIEALTNANISAGAEILDKTESMGGRFITIEQPEYPARLRELYDAPIGLYVIGNGKIDGDYIGVVGTRNPSSYGRETTRSLAHALVASGLGIASGFARGIDTIAHTSTIETGGPTIAVFGCGIDVVYPAENRTIYEKIIDRGVIVSEYAPGARPDGHHFPQRNRIIAGLSLGTLVIEAGLGSGALITAIHSIDMNRCVFAVPGRIDSPKSEGCHNLINSGAKLVTNVEDVLSELQPPFSVAPGDQLDLLTDLSEPERGVMEYLKKEPMPVDRISEDLNQDVSELLTTLLYLEMKGLVIQSAGKRFSRSV